MANPIKGEVSFEVGEKTYKLSYSTNALCELEEALGMSVREVSAVMGDADKFRMSMARTVFWAGMQDHQPGTEMAAVSEILSKMKANTTLALISQAFERAFPEDEAGVRPQQTTPAGNGEASLRRGKQPVSTPMISGDERPAK